MRRFVFHVCHDGKIKGDHSFNIAVAFFIDGVGGCLPVCGEQFGFAVTAPQQNITGLDDAVRIGQQVACAV